MSENKFKISLKFSNEVTKKIKLTRRENKKKDFVAHYKFTKNIRNLLINTQKICDPWNYSCSTLTKVSVKLTFLTPCTHTYVYVSGTKKC